MASLGIVLRGRRRESCAAAKIARFRGPVREIGCAGARSRVCEIVVGAGNPWTCGCELGADVSWNAAAGCVGCVACAALCRGTQWQAVGIGIGRVACVALCNGDWRRVLGIADHGQRRVIGIGEQGVVWVALRP